MLSYARGPETSLLEVTLFQSLAETATRFPHNPALVSRHQGIRLTWSGLLADVERVGRGLCGLGLKPGDRVGVWSTNCAEWILLQLACARAGLVLVNVNPAYRSHELRYIIAKSRMRALFFHERDAHADYVEILHDAREGQSTALTHAIALETEAWDAMLARAGSLPRIPCDPYSVANIQYTSGTTGSPKGVSLTHRNILNNGYLIGQALRLTANDRICAPVPMYHCFGCVMATLAAITTGAALILPSATFHAGAALEALQAERATAVYGVPTMFIAELEHPQFSRFDLTSLRTGIMAGAPCPVQVMKRIINEMHCPQITIAYGQTESSPVITMSALDDPIEVRVSTIGRVLPGTEAKIVSQVTGETVPAGDQGEICTRGYLVMPGYDADPKATARAIDSEGWLHTGDLGAMDTEGYFRITGRARDLIIRGGENIYPREVEEFLHTHPKIADVQVVGVPDERLGEVVCAWIRFKTGEKCTPEEIREFCNDRIAHFKIPQVIRFVEEFPMTVTGKVQKFRIREVESAERALVRAETV